MAVLGVVALVLLALISGGLGGAVSARSVRMLEGAAWLPSRIGQVTLISGSSARAMATVGVASGDHDLSVIQTGSDAYGIDRTAGTVQRVAGSTFSLSSAVSFGRSPDPDLQVLVGGHHVFVLDGLRGLVYDVDPETLTDLASPRPLDTQVGVRSAVVDTNGRLWVVDSSNGDLKWFDRAQGVRRAAAPGGTLLLAGGDPVLVAGGGASWLAADGAAAAHVSFDLDGAPSQVSGTPDGHLLVVVPSRGIVEACDRTGCDDAAYPLTSPGPRLGPAILDQGIIVVPDWSTGAAHVISTTSKREVATPQLLPAGAEFDIIPTDTVLFYNDRNSEHAGVLRPDGTFSPTEKYPPGNPNAALDQPAQSRKPPLISSSSTTDTASTSPPTSSNPATRSAPATPASTSTLSAGPSPVSPSSAGLPTVSPDPAGSADPAGGPSIPTGDGPTEPTSTPLMPDRGGPTASQTLTVTVVGSGTVTMPGGGICDENAGPLCSATFPAGQEVPLQATATAGSGWSFQRWQISPQLLSCGTNPTCRLRMMTSLVAEAVFGRTDPAQAYLHVALDGKGVVASEATYAIKCPDDCGAGVQDGSVAHLTETPLVGWAFAGWTINDVFTCGRQAQCAVPVNGPVNVVAHFSVAVTIDVSGGGRVDDAALGISCTTSCHETLSFLSTPRLSPASALGWYFVGWSVKGGSDGLPCPANADPCSFSTTQPLELLATFGPTLTVVISGNGQVTGPGVSCDALHPPCVYDIPFGTTDVALTGSGQGVGTPDWTGRMSCAATASCSVDVTAPATEEVTFPTLTERLQITPSGSGTITIDPGSHQCSAAQPQGCIQTFAWNTEVHVWVALSSDAVIDQPEWIGDEPCQGKDCTFALTNTVLETVVMRPLFSGVTMTGLGDKSKPTITVSGHAFGSTPPPSTADDVTTCGTYTNNGRSYGSNGLFFQDSGNDWVAGSTQACIGITVISWTPTQIVFGFGSSYDSYLKWYISTGDNYHLVIDGIGYDAVAQ